jgi:hypothetical protein
VKKFLGLRDLEDTHATAADVSFVLNWCGSSEIKNTSYCHRIKPCSLLPPRFIPHNSALRVVRAPAPSWKEVASIFFGRFLQGIQQNTRVTLNRARPIIMCPNGKAVADGSPVENTVNENAAEISTTANPVDWTADGVLPPEVRDEIYADTLPDDIVYHDNVLCSDVADVLSINHASREGIQEELTRKDRRIVFEYSSNTAMLHGLDSLPTDSLASYKNLIITVKGAYNGHSNIYSNNNGCHRTNISPTLLREGEEVSFHVVYACLDCKYQDFYKRELEFACPTILAKFERLTGMAFTAGVVPVNTHVSEDGPHVRAYALTVRTLPSNGCIFRYHENEN